MAWHNRYIEETEKIRTTIAFQRTDLLWISEHPIVDPYTYTKYDFPFGEKERNKRCYGANIIDILEKYKKENKTTKPPRQKTYWKLRNPSVFFAKPEDRKDEKYGCLNKRYCAGGKFINFDGDFVVVKKKSSVSINTILYKIAAGLFGSYSIATSKITSWAIDAWKEELIRTKSLYKEIIENNGEIADSEVKTKRAEFSISQYVEKQILLECCDNLGINPKSPIKRKTGRPQKQGKTQQKNNSNKLQGDIIELEVIEIDNNITIIGKIIKSYEELKVDTLLSDLTLVRLVSLLVSFQENNLEEDEGYLENYLDAANPNWREDIINQLEEEEINVKNPWEILGLEKNIKDPEIILTEYRRLMLATHPDTSNLPSWINLEIRNAYTKIKEQIKNND